MRMIGTIPAGDEAERFSDFLVTQNVQNMAEESASGHWDIWVERDDDVDRAKLELDAFLRNPADAKYDARSKAKQIRVEEEKKQKKRRTQYIDYRTRWSQAKQWAAPLTLILISISLAVGVATRVGQKMEPYGDYLRIASFATETQEQQLDDLMKRLANRDLSQVSVRDMVPDPGLGQILHGQVWRLVTPIFIHFGILHLIFNMFWLRDLGGAIEVQRGTSVLAWLVLAVAVISNLAEYYWSGPWFGGMSGVNYGLFGYIWIKQRYEPGLGLALNQQTVWIMMAWLFLCMSGMMGSVANAAHIVGLLVGAALAFAPILRRRTMR